MFFYAYNNIHRDQFDVMKYNIIPFKSLIGMVTFSGEYDFIALGYNLLGNIAVFIPLGFLIPFIIGRKLKKTILISFCIIVFAELMQLASRLGVFDIDDIFLNLIGCLVGYAVNSTFLRKNKPG